MTESIVRVLCVIKFEWMKLVSTHFNFLDSYALWCYTSIYRPLSEFGFYYYYMVFLSCRTNSQSFSWRDLCIVQSWIYEHIYYYIFVLKEYCVGYKIVRICKTLWTYYSIYTHYDIPSSYIPIYYYALYTDT